MKRYLLSIFCLFVFMTGKAVSNPVSDTLIVKIHYRIDSFDIDSAYMGNSLALNRLRHFIKESPQITGIVIYSYASPEGCLLKNMQLSEMRGIAVKNIIMSSLTGSVSLTGGRIRLCPGMDNWNALRDAIISRYHRRNRSAILAILDKEEPSYMKEKGLRKDKDSWDFIADKILPDLRYAEVVCIGESRPIGTLSAILPPPRLRIFL